MYRNSIDLLQAPAEASRRRDGASYHPTAPGATEAAGRDDAPRFR
jgi:hypothetical protein